MAAASLLVLFAAVGVDYGWQPDGTQSDRGDNIRYIVQVPPDQLDEIRRAGEVTSTLDPEIAGRVVQIVFRIGTDPLPRDAGRVISQPTAAGPASDPSDHASLPIPQFSPADSLASAPPPDLSGRAEDGSGSQSLLKPDPQAEGFTLPSTVRTAVGTNPSVSTDPVTADRDNRWSDIRGQIGSTGSSAAGSPAPTAARSNPTGPSTDPVSPGTSWANPPASAGSRAPASVATGSNGWGDAAASAAPSFSPQTTLPNPPSISSNLAGQAGARRGPTDPTDPTWSGYGTTPTFGTPPAGMSSNTAAAGLGPPANSSVSPPDFTRQPSAIATASSGDAAAGFTRDAAGNLYDRLGRPVDRQGRLIDPESGQLIDAAGNWVDQYGRRIDRYGRPLPGEGGTATEPSAVATLQPPPLLAPPANPNYAGGTAANPNYAGGGPANGNYPANPGGNYGTQTGAPATWGGAGYGQSGYGDSSQGQYPTQSQFANQATQGGFNSTATGQFANGPFTNGPPAGGRPGSFQQGYPTSNWGTDREPPSISDQAATAALAQRDKEAATVAADAAKPKKVAAQPFFNFILLISLVGNAYLVFETGNLRRKFRNMIANVRASKISTQPAN